MTKVYFADVTPLLDDFIFDAVLKRVSLKRQEKAIRLKHRCDKNLSLGAGLVADYALKDFTGENFDFDIEYQKNGKPYVIGRGDVHISISHSGNIALCAVSDFAVGADVQVHTGFKDDICRRYFGKSEKEYVFACDDSNEIKRRFFKVWALKEAYAKALGYGILGFDKFEIQPDYPVSLKSADCVNTVQFCEFNIDGYAMSVCTEDSGGVCEFKKINISELLIN